MAATGHVFPEISPTRRSYKPGKFPSSEFQGLNGAVTLIQFGQKAVDSSLEMVFENITDDQAYAIFQNYDKVMKGRDSTTLEADYVDLEGQMKGVLNKELAFLMSENPARPGNHEKLRYRYAEPPTITSVFPGRSTVTVVLRGYFDGSKNA